MIDNLGGVTSKLVGLALDAAMLRHQLTAHNIANADTPGYSAKRLSFEDHLARITMALNDPGSEASLQSEIDDLRQRLMARNDLIVSSGEPVALDQEMVELTENVLRYRALLDANSKRGDILKMAIKEGRN